MNPNPKPNAPALDSFWMPFTANREFKAAPRMLVSAEGLGLLVSDIAQHCGFRELPTFTRMFKRRYGMTPREARATSGGAI